MKIGWKCQFEVRGVRDTASLMLVGLTDKLVGDKYAELMGFAVGRQKRHSLCVTGEDSSAQVRKK